MNAEIDLERIAGALDSTPRIAYTAPHVYPHAAPVFKPSPRADRERPDSEHLRLYVHIPFCNYSCTFCCYAKRVGARREQKERYVKALKRELEWVAPGTPVSQFFVGGGTPTALPAELFDEMLEAITERMPFYGDDVHTVEASPESITDDHIAALKRRGAGRVSMGIQSLQDEVLDAVSRRHNENVARESCERIIDSGLILNIDLMYGLPGQDERAFRKDFEAAAELGVHAVTAYSLRLNEYTPMARTIALEDQLNLERLVRWRRTVRDTARDMGYTQTRWHTFKRLDSVAARHERAPCFDDDMQGYQFGIGMSARSHLGRTVYRNHSGLKTYLNRVEAGESPVEEVFPLREEDLQTQFVARTIGDGKSLRLAQYEQAFSRSFEEDYAEVIARLRSGGLIEMDDESVWLTDGGELVYDLVTLAFYPERARRWLLERLQDYQVA